MYTKCPEQFTAIFNEYDIIFLSETNLGYEALPFFVNYTKFADTDKKNLSVWWDCLLR